LPGFEVVETGTGEYRREGREQRRIQQKRG
jgi:hypothetical protein